MGMELFGIAVTILAGVLTYQAWKNGRWMKQSQNNTEVLIKELHSDTQSLLRELHRDSTEVLKELHEDTQTTLKEIAKLIASEGEKTRKTIAG